MKRFALICVFMLFGACVPEEESNEPNISTRTLEQPLVQPIDECLTSIDSEPGQACCGNNICEEDEQYTCSSDCSYCGDGTCNYNESPSNCSADCGTCGNNVCDNSETRYSCPTDCDLPTYVRLDRVRYCRGKVLCRSAPSYNEYGIWEYEEVKKRHQKKTFISKLSSPPRANVRRLIFISAGQQNSLWDNTTTSGLTGQDDHYKDSFGRRTKSKWIHIDRGLAHEVMERMGWAKQETFVGLAFDARFNFEFSRNEKGDIEDAYYRWLKTKFDPAHIESIYLAGHSRGGCLVARLGQRFTAEFPNTPVIVHSFDGVCTQHGSGMAHQEFGVTAARVDNPLNSNYRAFKVDLSARYPHKTHFAFLNQIGGEGIAGAHAFSDIHGAAQFYQSVGSRPWLVQRWWNRDHMNMDDTVVRNVAINHLASQCGPLGC